MRNKTTVKCLAMLALAGAFASCSSDDNDNDESKKSGYVWSTDDGLDACDHILFDANGNEAPNGNVIGNGNQQFVFTGKQTLSRGTYTLRGWVYIANGAELTIEPGTIIKGEKETKATLIAERGGKLIARGTAQQPIVFKSAQAAGNRRPGDWGGIILCGRARNNQNEMQIEGGPRTNKTVIDASQKSYSHTLFLAQTGNKYYDSWSTLVGSDGYTPIVGSPLLSGASFDGLTGFTKVSYIGALGDGNSWLSGWTNFDPENTKY